MRPRSIKRLASLNQEAFLVEVAQGLGLVAESAWNLACDAAAIGEGHARQRPFRILLRAAEEEAAKYFILLDAVRCPRRNRKDLVRQLRRFNDHLARGIYAEYVGLAPATMAEVRAWLAENRKEYYLDGPDEGKWVFRNWVLTRREQDLYVDYQEHEEGFRWWTPEQWANAGLGLPPLIPSSVALPKYMDGMGFSTPEALRAISAVFDDVDLQDDFSWHDLRDLNLQAIADVDAVNPISASDQMFRAVVENWLFPLYAESLDLEKQDYEDMKGRAG